MTNQLQKRPQGEDWYEALISDCNAIVVEAGFQARWNIIAGYHALGTRILEEKDKLEKYDTSLVSLVSESMDKSKRTIQRAVQCVKKYPTLDDLPGGKNLSWHKLCNQYLPSGDSKKKDQRHYMTCRIDKAKKVVYIKEDFKNYTIRYK